MRALVCLGGGGTGGAKGGGRWPSCGQTPVCLAPRSPPPFSPLAARGHATQPRKGGTKATPSRKKKNSRPRLAPSARRAHQRLAVGAAPVVGLLEQGAQDALVLGVQAGRHGGAKGEESRGRDPRALPAPSAKSERRGTEKTRPSPPRPRRPVIFECRSCNSTHHPRRGGSVVRACVLVGEGRWLWIKRGTEGGGG